MIVYYSFFSIIFILTLTHLALVMKKFTPHFASYILGERYNWDPKVDRLRTLLTFTFFITPLFLFKLLIVTNLENYNFNVALLSLNVILFLFCIWFNEKKIWSENFGIMFKNSFELSMSFPKNRNNITFKEVDNKTNVIRTSFIHFHKAVTEIPLYNKNIKCFNIDGFIDNNINNSRITKVTEVRSIQYLFLFYVFEYLNQNLSTELKNKQFELFNKYYTPRYRGHISKLSTSNWADFEKDYLTNFKNSVFYNQLSKELKIKLDIKAK